MIMWTINAFAGAGGNIGVKDGREYGELSNPIYSSVARLDSNGYVKGTAGFIAENIVITNRHVAETCIRNKCSVYFWDGTQYQTSDVEILAMPKEHKKDNGTDWAILKTSIPNKNFKQLAPFTTKGLVYRGGFGVMRLIPDEEIPIIKQALVEARDAKCEPGEGTVSCVNRVANKLLIEKYNLKPLFNDAKKFKIQQCSIHTIMNTGMVRTNCDSSSGDSGAPLLRGNQTVGLNNYGLHGIFDEEEWRGAYAVNTNNFYNIFQIIMAKENPGWPSVDTIKILQDDNIITDPQEIQRQAEQSLLNYQCN